MDGIIVINKPKNCTSHDVVKKVKKILNEKVGHTGTLEISKYLINHDKVYEAVLKIGEKTDTADAEGKIIETQNVKLSTLKEENIKIVLKSLIGEQKQIPPMYSAIKVNGKKLYEYARSGEIIKVEPRLIYIYNLELIKVANQEITYKVHCSKGTYIRTLCEQIDEKLGTVGYMKELKRLQVGEFKIEDSLTIDEIKENIQKKFITIEEYFKKYPKINLDLRKLQLFLNGVQLNYNLENGIYTIYNNEKFIGTGTIKNNLLKRDIVM